MPARRKWAKKKPLPNRWPDFVRLVAWPIGERREAEFWGLCFLHAHEFALFASIMLLIHSLTTNQQESITIAVALVMALPFVSFTVSDYCYS